MFACPDCGVVIYCSQECRERDWQARHRDDCKEMGDLMSSEESALRSCRAAIMHVFGYMDEGEFQRVLARGQTKIIQEVLSRSQAPVHSRHLHLDTRRYNDTPYCVVALSSASFDGTQPPCASFLDPYTGRFAVYRVFNMARVAERGTPLPLPPHKARTVMEAVKATVGKAIEVCLRESQGRVLPNPLINCDLSEVGPLFWWKSTCVVGHREWFFVPTVGSICESAMVRSKSTHGEGTAVTHTRSRLSVCRKLPEGGLVCLSVCRKSPEGGLVCCPGARTVPAEARHILSSPHPGSVPVA